MYASFLNVEKVTSKICEEFSKFEMRNILKFEISVCDFNQLLAKGE